MESYLIRISVGKRTFDVGFRNPEEQLQHPRTEAGVLLSYALRNSGVSDKHINKGTDDYLSCNESNIITLLKIQRLAVLIPAATLITAL